VNALNVPGPDRPGSLTIPAAATAPGSSLIEAVLAAFQAYRVVAIGDAIAVIFVPYLLAIVPPLQSGPVGLTGGGLALGGRELLLRITPAAGFSVQQAVPRFSQVTGVSYTPNWGYYPLAPWVGFAVECAWAAAALALAFYLLRRRDA
jgi:hypothetical protein